MGAVEVLYGRAPTTVPPRAVSPLGARGSMIGCFGEAALLGGAPNFWSTRAKRNQRTASFSPKEPPPALFSAAVL